MVRNAIADDYLLTYLHSVAKDNTYTVGLIFGQHVSGKDYIIHFAKTPFIHQIDDDKSKETPRIKTVNDIHEEWVADHARQATRMLPGGMHVLGVFIISPEDITSSNSLKIKSILTRVHKELDSSKYLFGNISNGEKLFLNYCSQTHQYVCKAFEVVTSSFKPADIKFQPKAMKWIELECKFNMDQIYPIGGDNEGVWQIKKHVNILLDKLNDRLMTSQFLFDGELKNDDDSIDNVGKKKISKTNKSPGNHNDNPKPLQISILQPCVVDDSNRFKISDNVNLIKVFGYVACKLWLHPKVSIQEASTAVAQDILRSLSARLEMHWDSLTEEEHGEEVSSVHEPPRRVLIQLPHSDVAISDYLFPGEGPQDAQNSLEELLDFKIKDTKDVADVEGQADMVDYYNDQMEVENNEKLIKKPIENNKSLYFIGLGVAILVLFISLIIHFIQHS